jgi:hypothetical protein
MSIQCSEYHGGRYQSICDLVAQGARSISIGRTWNNPRLWHAMSCDANDVGLVISDGEYRTRKELVAAVRRAFGDDVAISFTA